MSAVVNVLSPGLHTTVQDLGRWGYQASGVPVAGPMDLFSHRLANAVVGNDRGAATFEVTLTGPTVAFEDARVFAVAGAEFELFLDDRPVPTAVAIQAHAGSVLRFGARRHGARAYLAVRGGLDVPVVLGSRATHVPTKTGGWQGRALRRGDVVPLGPVTSRVRRMTQTATGRSGEVAHGRAVVRVLPGPQADRFEPEALALLESAPYTVSVESDRMGYRLDGAPLPHRRGADIISDATPVGALQVPASRQPLLLMADRQTTGGYAKLATVITADIGVAAQVAPGERLAFTVCTRAEALRALIARERPLLELESA